MYPPSTFASRAPAAPGGIPGTTAGRDTRAGRLTAPLARMGRLVLAGLLIAALGAGAIACGSSSPPANGSATPSRSLGAAPRAGLARYLKAVKQLTPQGQKAFVTCMRRNGEPSFPGTPGLSSLMAAGITLRSSTFQAAIGACKSKLAG
jgi:hypothetical protein